MAIAAALSGCQIPRISKVSPSVEGSQIVVYRPDVTFAAFRGILDERNTEGYILYNTARVYVVEPGTHTFAIKLPIGTWPSNVQANTLSFAVGKNERKFIRLRDLDATATPPKMTFHGYYDYAIEEVSVEQGMQEVKGLQLFYGNKDAAALGFEVVLVPDTSAMSAPPLPPQTQK